VFWPPLVLHVRRELGEIESPLVLTNTLSVGTAFDAVAAWTLTQEGNGSVRSVNATTP
jgi:D-aminopeptidase